MQNLMEREEKEFLSRSLEIEFSERINSLIY